MESKIIIPILSGAFFFSFCIQQQYFLKKETLTDLSSLQNVAAVNTANKMPA